MNSLDLFILIPIAVGFIFGLFKGLIKELTSLAAIFLGIYAAKLLSPWLAGILIKSSGFSVKTAHPVAYVLIFIAVAVALLIIAKTIDKVFDSISLDGLNKLMGGIFGGLKYALIISVVINLFNIADSKFKIISQATKSESIVYEPILNLAPKLWDVAAAQKNELNQSENKNTAK